MPDDIEEFWEDIRIYPDPDPFAPETLDARQQAVSSAAQRMITDGVDPRLVSRAQSLTDREIIEARDIINTVRGSHSWRSIPTHEARRNFINELHDEIAQRRLLDLHPIAIAANGLIINPGETLIEFEERCRPPGSPMEWQRATGMEAHERALNRLAALGAQRVEERPSNRSTHQQVGAANLDSIQRAMEGMLDQPNNTPTLGVPEIPPPTWSWNDLEPLTEREQIIRNHAFMDGYASREPQAPLLPVSEEEQARTDVIIQNLRTQLGRIPTLGEVSHARAALDITQSFRTLGLNCQVSLNPVGELRLESQGAITIDGRAITLHPRRR